MPKITFVSADGTRNTIDAASGRTVMEAARDHNIRGIRAECGGEASCCTCHCYVDADWIARLPARTDNEATMIEFAYEPRDSSRLSCQLVVDESLDGLVLYLPERQL